MDRLKGAIGAVSGTPIRRCSDGDADSAARQIGIPLWRIFEADPLIKKHRAEHYRELGLNGGVAPR